MSTFSRCAVFILISTGLLGGWYVFQKTAAIPDDRHASPSLLSDQVTMHARPLLGTHDSNSPRNFDPNVRTTSLVSTSLWASQAAVAATGKFAITSVSQDVFTWKINRDGHTVRLLNVGDLTVTGTGADANDVEVLLNDKEVDATVNEAHNEWNTKVTVTGTGVQELLVRRKSDQNIRHLAYVIPPNQDDAQLLQPVIRAVSNNSYKGLAPLTDVRMYQGYLRMSGLRVRNGTLLQFAVFKENGEFIGIAVPSRPVNPNSDASWEAELDLKLPVGMEPGPDAKGFVLAVALSGNRTLHRHSDPARANRVNFEVAPTSGRLKASLTTPLRNGDDTADLGRSGNAFLSNKRRFVVEGTVAGTAADANLPEDSRVVVFLNNVATDVKDVAIAQNEWTATIDVDADTEYTVEAATVLGRDVLGDRSAPATVQIRQAPPAVLSVDPTNAALAGVTVRFNEPIIVPADFDQAFIVRDRGNRSAALDVDTTAATPAAGTAVSELTLPYKNVPPDVYNVSVVAAQIRDEFGNQMKGDYKTQLFRPIGAEEPLTTRGITGPSGPYVVYPEYTKPRPFQDGFNPSDHVETRVSRLYYYRDAHRVAQIINREAKSFNRAAVRMQEQLADKSRQIADQATDERRSKERQAVEAARETREAEQALQQAEQTAQRAASEAAIAAGQLRQLEIELQNLASDGIQQPSMERETENRRAVVGRLEQVAAAGRSRAQSEFNKVQQLREEESRATQAWQQSIAVEDRAREEQFRREVAAAHEDPDTYAPGTPSSQDPVRQVSVSVIGEGLIQLRGPMKGINLIRMMVNQIDAPVGQVRIGVHSVQINGEDGKRMERVAGKIQRYIDHSRFLTMQAAEMLRRAIVQVAAQKAMEVNCMTDLTQAGRDRKYLDAFYGEDFIRELEAMDSEFLMTGNKLLSLHSMDTTSLASALFNMALAKNTTRLEILQLFEGMMAIELPMAEQAYFEAGLTCDGKEKLFGKYCRKEEFCLFAQNARFQSIRGFFNTEIAAADTMTPVQREFVRLAQIFKSRLIVEMELKQRILERSVIEERLGDRETELRKAKAKEEDAKRALENANTAIRTAQRDVLAAANTIQTMARTVEQSTKMVEARANGLEHSLYQTWAALIASLDIDAEVKAARDDSNLKTATELEQIERDGRARFMEPLDKPKTIDRTIPDTLTGRIRKLAEQIPEAIGFEKEEPKPIEFSVRASDTETVQIRLTPKGDGRDSLTVVKGRDTLMKQLDQAISTAEDLKSTLAQFDIASPFKEYLESANQLLDRIKADKRDPEKILDCLHRSWTMLKNYRAVSTHVNERASFITGEINFVVSRLGAGETSTSEFAELYQRWYRVDQEVRRCVKGGLLAAATTGLDAAATAFQQLVEANLEYQFALQEAEASRRPLDHKKFLDMLVDEMEDKYIELLEGTRAHTANIDAYIKRLMTTLDDDFNTQFYYPSFRQVRTASQMWDVQTGQVETTTILANNRSFAKVSPQATMEFDLPKRDILISEAINGAKAMIDDVGALANDPSFVSMAQIKSGQPTSTPGFGSTGGLSTVRNVLPGLSTDTAEDVLGQHGPGGNQFGSALESLIPDPAIYKFETGTGFEIRPVLDPDGQSVVFHFNYMYTTNIREPVRADEKHLGRVKRHFIDTDVQLANFELREISRYTVALKAARTSQGVPLLQDIPVVGVLWRPLPSAESSLQQNVILGQATIFPTLFDLMGLRWAPVVADLDPLKLSNDEFIVRNRRRVLMNRVFDQSSSQVDTFLRIPEAERRMDLYRSQETLPAIHPNGYQGPGGNLRDSQLQEGFDPGRRPGSQFIPGRSIEGSTTRPVRPGLQLHQPMIIPTPDGSHHESSRQPDASPPQPELLPPPTASDEPDVTLQLSPRQIAPTQYMTDFARDSQQTQRTSYEAQAVRIPARRPENMRRLPRVVTEQRGISTLPPDHTTYRR